MARLLARVEEARRSRGRARRALAREVNEGLLALATSGGARAAADVLHTLLDTGRLAELADGNGRSCRASAVEALLALGFPYALEVSPEDLAAARAEQRARRSRRPWVLGAVGAALLIHLGGMAGPTWEALELWQGGLGAAGLVGGLTLAVRRRRRPHEGHVRALD